MNLGHGWNHRPVHCDWPTQLNGSKQHAQLRLGGVVYRHASKYIGVPGLMHSTCVNVFRSSDLSCRRRLQNGLSFDLGLGFLRLLGRVLAELGVHVFHVGLLCILNDVAFDHALKVVA